MNGDKKRANERAYGLSGKVSCCSGMMREKEERGCSMVTENSTLRQKEIETMGGKINPII